MRKRDVFRLRTKDYRRTGLRRRGLSAALAFCLVAVGAAAYFSFHAASPVARARTGEAAKAASRAASSAAPTYFTVVSEEALAPLSEAPAPARSEEPSAPSEVALDVVTPAATFFVMPLTGEVLKECKTDELQYTVTYGDWRLHTGVDIAGALGAEVHAAGDGTVVSVKEDTKWGLTLVVNHGNGILATYCGLAAPLVKEGDTVAANQTIATLGEIPCESVEPVHLHLEMTKENTPVDPLHIMGMHE